MADYRPKMRLMMSRNVPIFKLTLLVLLPAALTVVMANVPKYPEMKGVHLRISATQVSSSYSPYLFLIVVA